MTNKAIDTDTYDELNRQMYRMTVGLEALEGLGVMLTNAIDQDIGVTGQQAGSLLKCVEFSLLETQRDLISTINK